MPVPGAWPPIRRASASGNLIQIPIHIPVNACGNSISVIGLLNPAFGNSCVNA